MPSPPRDAALAAVSITAFKERAKQIVDQVAREGPVAILRHRRTDAVLISAGDYAEYLRLKRERLNFLTSRYDAMVEHMQSPQATAGVDALFSATSEDLGKAALDAASRG